MAVEGQQPVLEADSNSDSDYGSSLATDTTSLASTVLDYVHENGRRYHSLSRGKYVMPNDETEQNRLDLHHHAFLVMLGGEMFLAPVKEPQRILDCGTGTGIWALDIGAQFPAAHVVGVDLSPIQPSWTLGNVEFQVDDVEKDWTWPLDHFDFIHSRILNVSIRDWPNYVKQMYKHTAPGGWVELVEGDFRIHSDDGTVTPECGEAQFLNPLAESGEALGLRMLNVGEDYVKYMEDAGFVDIQMKPFKQPWGRWPKDKALKEIGAVVELQTKDGGLESFGLYLMTRMGMTPEEISKRVKNCAKEIAERKVHGYTTIYHVWGRKPEKSE